MARTPDRTPGPSVEEELQLEDNGIDPTVVGGLTLNAGALKGKDSVGVFDLRSGAGLSEAAHKTLLHLIHFISEGPADGFTTGATKTITGGFFPTLIEWKRSDATLLVTKTVTRSGGGATLIKPTPVVWKMYDADGIAVLATVSDAVTYSGVAEVSRVRSIS